MFKKIFFYENLENETIINEKIDNPNSHLLLNVNSNSQNKPLKYQYSFTDSIMLDDVSSVEFKVKKYLFFLYNTNWMNFIFWLI